MGTPHTPQHEEVRAHTLARLVGGKAQGEKKEGLLTSGVLCAGVAATADPGMLDSGVLGEMGFKFRARSALRASLWACTAQSPRLVSKMQQSIARSLPDAGPLVLVM